MSIDRIMLVRLVLILSVALGASTIALAPVSADPGGPPEPQPETSPPP